MGKEHALAIALWAVALALVVPNGAAGSTRRADESGGFKPPEGARSVRWIAVGGGSGPRSTQVSLEQDLGLAADTLGKRGVLLFAGGPNRYGVQVLQAEADGNGDRLLRELGDLFDPLDGRDARYRHPIIPVDGPAAAGRFVEALSAAVGDGDEALLVYVAAHGDIGNAPADNVVRFWGDEPLSVRDLADLLDAAPGRRTVRLVMASCYAGGFAELVFARAEAEAGPAADNRCGLFATEWDREASGCDPNPNRAAQEGYGMHFWHALRREDRRGAKLPLKTVDLDGDRRISLLEAHTRARIASRSIDVPTSTSERWLRHAAPAAGDERDVELPEEEAVIAALGRDLRLADEGAALLRLQALDTALAEADDGLAKAERREMEAASALRISLLEKWPVIDDPWHPGFPSLLQANRTGIAEQLHEGREAKALRAARAELEQAWARADRLLVEQARVKRLVRAYETRHLARRLRGAAGPAWERFERLLACERGQP